MRIYNKALIILGTLIVLLGYSVTGTGGENTPPFTPQGWKWMRAPSGHEVGKDNDPGLNGPGARHFAGTDCGNCHTPGGPAKESVFTVSGTIYKDKLAREPLEGAEIILQDADGNVISMTSNSAGNFYTYTPVAFTPVEDDNPENPRNWRYKAWVKYGNDARPMNYLAYVGSNWTPRMSCNMHHGSGVRDRGALSAGNFKTLPSFPARNISFANHVRPILRNRCKACHLPASMNPQRTYFSDDPAPFNYSGGLDLSSYTKDPGSDKGIREIVNTVNPEQSLILAKTVTGSTHSGGSFWNTDWSRENLEFHVIRQWIAEGAKDN